MLSNYAQNMINNSTCCHSVDLTKNDVNYIGIYNGLGDWGRVEDGSGNLVETLMSHRADKYDSPVFTTKDFVLSGYTIV